MTDHSAPEGNNDAYQEIRQGIVNVTLSWGHAENELIGLLTAILKHDNVRVPSAIYFSLNGIEGRMRLVDRALSAMLHKHALKLRVLAVWGRYLNAATRLRKVRNKVAHGQIVYQVSKKWPMARPMLTSPIYDVVAHDRRPDGEPPQGLTGADLRNSDEAVEQLGRQIRTMAEFVRAFHLADDASLHGILAQLEAARPSPEDHPSSQIDPEQ